MTEPTPSAAPHPTLNSVDQAGYLLPDHELKRVQALLAEFDRVNLLHEAEHHTIVRNVVGSIITDMTGNAIAPMGIVISTIRAQVRHFNDSRPQATAREPIHDAPAAGPDPVPEARDDGNTPIRGFATITARVGYMAPRKVVPVYGFVEHWPRGRKVFVGADYDAKHTYCIVNDGEG